MTIQLDPNTNFKSEIGFYIYPEKWIMRITPNGILFNREGFPDWQPDDFAKSIMDILSNEFRLKFIHIGEDLS